MARTSAPPVNQVSKGAVAFTFALMDQANGVYYFTGATAPVDGTSGDGAGWADIGSEYVALDTGKHYYNEGTKASPTWKIVTTT